MQQGGMGVIEEGALKGRKFLIPTEVFVEKGVSASGSANFSLACLRHEKFIPTGGCPDCKVEREKKEALGL